MLEDLTSKDKIYFWIGAISFLAAIILIAFVPPAKFDAPLWSVSAILAASTFAYYLSFLVRTPSLSEQKKGYTITCADEIRDKTLVFCIFFVLVALLLRYNDKYEDFTVSICPEILLVAITIVCWRMSSFFPTEY